MSADRTRHSGSGSCSSASRCRRRTTDDTEASLDELALLVDTAGADEVGRVVQRRDAPDPATYVGKGKAEELRELSPRASTADTVVFDNELTPGAAVQPREAARPHGHRPHRGDPRHLRPERPQPRGQGPGRAGPAPLPAAPPAPGKGARPVSSRRGGIGTRRGPGETQLEVDRRRIMRRITKLEPELQRPRPHRAHAAQGRAAAAGLQQRRASSATPTPASRRCSTGSPTPACSSRTACSPRSTRRPAGSSCPAASRCCHRHRRVRAQAAPPAGRGVQVARSRSWREADLLVHVVDASAPDPEGQIDAVRAVLAEIGADQRARAARVQQGRPRARTRPSGSSSATRASVAISALHRRGHRRAAPHARRSAAGAGRRSSSCSSRTTAATCSPRSTARARCVSEAHDDDGVRLRARLDAGRRRRASPSSRSTSRDGRVRRRPASSRPPYPYDRLDALAGRWPSAIDGGLRRPVDRHAVRPAARRRRRRARRRRTPSAATRRRSAPPRCARPPRRGSTGASASTSTRRHVAACVGTKEFVGTPAAVAAPAHARPRHRARTRRVSYPTYEMGAMLAGCRPVPVPVDDHWRLDLPPIDDDDAARALCLWVNTPGNPTGALDDLGAAAAWGRAHGVPVFSDECYVEFTWDGAAARTILEHGTDGVRRRALAVEAIEPRRRARRLLRRRRRPRALPARGAQARRDDGARPGAGRRRRRARRRRARRGAARCATSRGSNGSRSCWLIGRACRSRCPRAASTCG